MFGLRFQIECLQVSISQTPTEIRALTALSAQHASMIANNKTSNERTNEQLDHAQLRSRRANLSSAMYSASTVRLANWRPSTSARALAACSGAANSTNTFREEMRANEIKVQNEDET